MPSYGEDRIPPAPMMSGAGALADLISGHAARSPERTIHSADRTARPFP